MSPLTRLFSVGTTNGGRANASVVSGGPVTIGESPSRLFALAPIALLLAVVFGASPANAMSIPAADPERLGSVPVGEISEVVLPERPGRARAAAWSPPPGASGGVYQAGGMSIRVFASPEFVPDPQLDQTWANFFAGLPQAGDASSMFVYFVTPPEMTAICSERAAACYDPNNDLMILTGDNVAVDGTTPIEEVAAHEFAHHIANRRSNDPWLAVNWGPKRWASLSGVCPGVLNDELFPGDQGDNYPLNPGEGWAETYRVAAGGSPSSWEIVDRVFYPSADEIEAALQDARDPWLENEVRSWSGRFSRGRSRLQRIRVDTPLDGSFNLSLRSSRGLDVDLYVLDENDKQLISRGIRGGRSERVNTYVCGDNDYYVYMRRASKRTGTFRLSLTWPG